MQILFVSGRETTYSRNSMLISVLRKMGYSVDVGTFQTKSHSILLRTALTFLNASRKLKERDYFAIVCGFYGHLLTILLKKYFDKPIVFDAFVSTFDTLCNDRSLCTNDCLIGRLSKWIDQYSCASADIVLVDTNAQKKYFSEKLNVISNKVYVVYASCNEDIFFPRRQLEEDYILFYSSFLPLHGVSTILQAARHLERENIKFRLIGPIRKLKGIPDIPTNVELLNSVKLQELPTHIAKSKICLGGHFGKSEKAKRVISSKTFECMAMAKAVIVGANEANSELFTHGEDSWFCEMDNPLELAKAIKCLFYNDKVREHISLNARKTFLQKASYSIISNQLHKAISSIY